MFAILEATSGALLSPNSPGGTEVVFCGSYAEDFSQAQQALLGAGIFPERLELSSVAILGGMQGVLTLQESKAPTLVLEIGRESTHCFIVNGDGVDLARPIPHGINSMIPIAQKEMGLRDEEAAAKLLFSNTFDFTGMGPNLVKKLLKELQSSIGFFEVQTGQSIGQLYCSLQPPGFGWLSGTLASALGVAQLPLDLKPWLAKQGIKFAPGVCPDSIPGSWFGILSLMANNQPSPASHEAQ
jgi:Tfp pilus assembly PilM family ATPase